MGVTIWQSANMDQLVAKLKLHFPEIRFTAGDTFHWSPATRQITFKSEDSEIALCSLLHEVGHGALQHTGYETDIGLLRLEMDAWLYSQSISPSLGILITDERVQASLDTYRDWLHSRSTCPACRHKGIQIDRLTYRCFNCHAKWHVSSSRFCRIYRLSEKKTDTPLVSPI